MSSSLCWRIDALAFTQCIYCCCCMSYPSQPKLFHAFFKQPNKGKMPEIIFCIIYLFLAFAVKLAKCQVVKKCLSLKMNRTDWTTKCEPLLSGIVLSHPASNYFCFCVIVKIINIQFHEQCQVQFAQMCIVSCAHMHDLSIGACFKYNQAVHLPAFREAWYPECILTHPLAQIFYFFLSCNYGVRSNHRADAQTFLFTTFTSHVRGAV